MAARRVWQYAAKAVMMDGDPEGWPQQVSRDCTRSRLAQRRQYVQLYQRRLLARRRQRLPSPQLPSLDGEGKSPSFVEAPHQVCLPSHDPFIFNDVQRSSSQKKKTKAVYYHLWQYDMCMSALTSHKSLQIRTNS